MTTISRFALGLVLCFIFGLIHQDSKTQSPSSDIKNPCDWAISQVDLNQCYAEQYRKVEASLNVYYQKVVEAIEKDLGDAQNKQDEGQSKYEEQAIQKLKASQKAWVEYRDLNCDAAKFEVSGGSMSPMVWAGCMALVTEHRISDLKDAYGNFSRRISTEFISGTDARRGSRRRDRPVRREPRAPIRAAS
jgi:uncharacterized protein YecT (DUF1311 family)